MTTTKGESPNPKPAHRPHTLDGETSFIHIKCKPADKSMWVKAAMAHYQANEGVKGGLSAWIKQILNAAAHITVIEPCNGDN